MTAQPVDWEQVIGFAPVVRRGPLVTVAGTGPVDDHGRVVSPGDAAGQARRCLARVEQRLASVGAGLADVVQTRIMLSRTEDWEQVGRVHGEVFGPVRPVTTMIGAELVDPAFLVEIEAAAWVP